MEVFSGGMFIYDGIVDCAVLRWKECGGLREDGNEAEGSRGYLRWDLVGLAKTRVVESAAGEKFVCFLESRAMNAIRIRGEAPIFREALAYL